METLESKSSPESLKQYIREIPDFPKKGILFKDVTPLLKDPNAFRLAVGFLADHFAARGIEQVIGVESRGFIFGAAVAYRLNAGFIPIRKKGKLPSLTIQMPYLLEYGEDILEVHQDCFKKGTKVLIIDDLLATGGTAQAVSQLVEKVGGNIQGVGFVIELSFLKGREKLQNYPVHAIIRY